MPTIVVPDGKRPEDTFVIQNEQYLVNNIEARHYTSYLFVNNVFSEDEMESVDDTIEFHERNRLFLKILAEKGKEGYQVFKRGLSKRGYLNSDLIEHQMKVRKVSIQTTKHIIVGRASREFIDPKDETKILQNRAILIRKLEASRLTGYLATKQVIDGHDMSMIDALPKSLGNKELLRTVCSRGNSAFMWFVESLRVNGYGRLGILLLGRPVTSSTNIQQEEEEGTSSEEESSSSTSSASFDNDSESQSDQHDHNEEVKSTKSDQNDDTSSQDILQQSEMGQNNESTQDDIGKEQDTETNDTDHESSNEPKVNRQTSQTEANKDIEENHNNNDQPKEGQIYDNEAVSGSTESNLKTKPEQEDNEAESNGDRNNPEHMADNKEDTNNIVNITDATDQMQSDIETNQYVRIRREKVSSSKSKRSEHRRSTPSPFKKVVIRNVVREPIDYAQAEKLKSHLDVLERSLDATSAAKELVGSEVMDKTDAETIRSLRESHQKVRELISLVLWGGPQAYELFLQALLASNQTLIHNVLTAEKKTSIRKSSSGIPCIVIDEVELVHEEDESIPEPPSNKSPRNKPYKFKWAKS